MCNSTIDYCPLCGEPICNDKECQDHLTTDWDWEIHKANCPNRTLWKICFVKDGKYQEKTNFAEYPQQFAMKLQYQGAKNILIKKQ